MWLLLSPAQLNSVAAGQQLTPMQLRQLASAARKASKSGAQGGGGGRGRGGGHEGLVGGAQQGGGAAAGAMKRRSMSERFQLLISAPSASEPAAPSAEPTAKWRDAPSIPGLPSMDRVWGVLSAMRPAGASRRGSIKPDAEPQSAQPQSAQPQGAKAHEPRAARVAVPPLFADTASAAGAGEKGGSPPSGVIRSLSALEDELVELERQGDAADPPPLTPSVTSTRAPRPPPSNRATPTPPPPPRLACRIAVSACRGSLGSSCVRVKVSFVAAGAAL